MGPPDRRPSFPATTASTCGATGWMPARSSRCLNWLQVKDNSNGSGAHRFLHALSKRLPVHGGVRAVPEIDWKLTDAGMVYLATRRVLSGLGPGGRFHAAQRSPVHARDRGATESSGEPAGDIRWAVPNTTPTRRTSSWRRWIRLGGSSRSRWRSRASDSPTIAPTPNDRVTPARTGGRSVEPADDRVHALEHLGSADRG